MFVRGRWWYMPDCTFMNKIYWIWIWVCPTTCLSFKKSNCPVKEVYCLSSYDQTSILHVNPRFHINAIISSAATTGLIVRHRYQIYRFAMWARRSLVPMARIRWSHFGTAPAPGHVCQVNNLVFWVNDATPNAASCVVGYASDTASRVARIEFESNLVRLGDPITYTRGPFH